ncbi:hypothetical protein QFZ35_003044 [Arthrobacter ulcerisalmonis]|nr:hypothetical protein [Arthrobacter ulcerisalmonis]MDQ0664546.1 hypothetical protein [Arthrobacter ulcerisalmonis]
MTPSIKTGLKVAGAVSALVLAFGIGVGSTSAKTVEVEKVVEKSVPGPERIVTKTVTEKVEVTPQACLTFITLADQLFGYAKESMTYAGDALDSVPTRDYAKLSVAKDGMESLAPKLQALTTPVNTARAECRSKQ